MNLVFHGCHVQEKRDWRRVINHFPVDGPGHIGVFHTSVTGEWSKNPCLPCTLPELQERNYDYWILGHVHQPIELAPNVRWPGVGKYWVVEA